jgi:CRISPR-associated protein Csm5
MVFRRQDVSTYTKGVAELPIYIEYLKPMTELPFFITIDQTVFGCMKKYGIESIADILRILQYFQDRVVKEVYPIFSEYMQTFSYSKDGTVPNFSIGGSAGYHTKSIVAALAPNSKEANDYVKKIMANNFRQHKHMELDHKIAPRTLKVEKYANEYLPVGLCRIEEKL